MRVVDMHCDTISELWSRRAEGKAASLRENDLHVDLKRLRESEYLLQNYALFVDWRKCVDPWEKVCQLHRLYQGELAENADWIAPVYRFADIAENEAAGKLSSMLTVEEGAVCGGEIEKLHRLYQMGVRMLTLTWNYPNELGYPNLNVGEKGKAPEEFLYQPDTTDGLTERGVEFVEEMERLGMIVDVSHLSDAGFYQVYEHAKMPFVASHSNARSVCRCVRNLTDDMIRKLAERGGVMGLNFCADFLREVPHGGYNPGAVEDVVCHARHITNTGGTQVLGLGSDFDGIDTNEGLPGAQSMERLWKALKDAGYTERELDMIFAENVLRVYEEVIK